eukprot:UN19846
MSQTMSRIIQTNTFKL